MLLDLDLKEFISLSISIHIFLEHPQYKVLRFVSFYMII